MRHSIKQFLKIASVITFLGVISYGVYRDITIAHLAALTGTYPTFQESLDAARRDPNDAAAQRGIGEHYLLQKNFPKAEFYWRKAVRLQPESRYSLFMLATILQREGRKADASQLYQQLIDKDSTDTFGKAAIVMKKYLFKNKSPNKEQ